MDYKEMYRLWTEDPYFDEETKKELLEITDEDEIKDRFYKELSFGTGGLRGVIGAGSNRMNFYTVRKATQGLANYILKQNGQDKGAAIAYDSRNMSPEFARETALCLNANGIKTYLFESLRPTPELSFALRELGCVSGVVITASHNPPEYNGYKVYWEDGAQITYPMDEAVINEVNAVGAYANAKTMDQEAAEKQGLFHIIGKEIDDKYIAELKKLVLNPQVIRETAKDMKIVYTPLHGTGNLPVQRILAELGFEQVYVVAEQAVADGRFPTVDYPNPEDPKAFAMALDLAKEVDADIILATDPDADRLGIYAKDVKTGEYISFTGNMSGMIICEYLISQMKEKGILPANGALVTTIVSGKMAAAVAEAYDIKLIETLTGFKYIGEQIKLFEETGSNEYVFGYEESYGCLVGTHARDKDAVVAVMSLCEAAAYYKSIGKTLWDQMICLYEKYGYYKEGLAAITLKGIEGTEKIAQILENLRQDTPKEIGGYQVLEFRDYEEDKVVKSSGEITVTGLPKSNVLYFALENDAWCCVRPSGTEPKIKFYIGVKGSDAAEADQELKKIEAQVLTWGEI